MIMMSSESTVSRQNTKSFNELGIGPCKFSKSLLIRLMTRPIGVDSKNCNGLRRIEGMSLLCKLVHDRIIMRMLNIWAMNVAKS